MDTLRENLSQHEKRLYCMELIPGKDKSVITWQCCTVLGTHNRRHLGGAQLLTGRRRPCH